MGKRKSGKFRKNKERGINVDSEDELRNEEQPDQDSRKYIYDEVDEFNERREQALLDAGKPYKVQHESDNEEVYSLDLSDDDDDEISYETVRRHAAMKQKDDMESDIEEEEDEIDVTKWGKRNSHYFGTDFINDVDDELAEDETNEVNALLGRASALFVDDVANFKEIVKTTVKAGEIVTKRAKDQNKRMEVFSEVVDLLDDLKVKLSEIRDQYQPLVDMVRLGEIPDGPGAEYINSKYHLLLNYCTNVCFCIMLNVKGESLKFHPVIETLVSYTKLLEQLEPLDQHFKDDIQQLLSKAYSEDENNTVKKKTSKKKRLAPEKLESDVLMVSKTKTKKNKTAATPDISKSSETTVTRIDKKRKLETVMETEDEKKALEMYEYLKKGNKRKAIAIASDEDQLSEEEMEDEGTDSIALEENKEEPGKRGITYQIAKNKGLTPYRSKERRNPRVKYRMKYRKAQIRRKGQVREVRKETQKYGGEHSGIKSTAVRSIKLK
ncbi:hypothetical protein CHUAL_008620 [Chamberlinius hualienensis]